MSFSCHVDICCWHLRYPYELISEKKMKAIFRRTLTTLLCAGALIGGTQSWATETKQAHTATTEIKANSKDEEKYQKHGDMKANGKIQYDHGEGSANSKMDHSKMMNMNHSKMNMSNN